MLRSERPIFNVRKIFFVVFRHRKMKLFYAELQPSSQTRLLDIGGAPNTWLVESQYSINFPITLVNLCYPDRHMLTDARFIPVDGDANVPSD